MLWWLSQLTHRQHLQASSQLHVKVLGVTAALTSISEVNVSWPRSLLMLWGFGSGLSPNLPMFSQKHELQSPKTRHFGAWGSSAPHPWCWEPLTAKAKLWGSPGGVRDFQAASGITLGLSLPEPMCIYQPVPGFWKESPVWLDIMTSAFMFSWKNPTRNEYLPSPAVQVRRIFQHAPAQRWSAQCLECLLHTV